MTDIRSFSEILNNLRQVIVDFDAASKIKPPIIEPTSTNEVKRKAFKNALETLSSVEMEVSLDDNAITAFIAFFENLYSVSSNTSIDGINGQFENGNRESLCYQGFRHMYSDASEVMFAQLDPIYLDHGVPYGVILLEANLVVIKNVAMQRGCSHGVSIGLTKLQDHISLEIHRMRYMAVQNTHMEETAKRLTKEFNERIASSIRQANKEFNSQIQKTKDGFQRNSVTTLGIFAAIVIAFTSATAFSSSVLQSMAGVSIYRLSLTILMLGFIVFNVLCALVVFLAKISNIAILKKEYVIIVDIVLVALMALVSLAKIYNWFGASIG